MRASDGLRCYTSTGNGFDHVWITPMWADASGLGSGAQSATIRLAGGRAQSNAISTALTGGCSVSPGRSSNALALAMGIVLALVIARRRR